MKEAENYYGFEMAHKNGPIRDAVSSLIEEKPEIKACLLGTRKGDPGAHGLEAFSPTDAGWPALMRVSPIIDWSYREVFFKIFHFFFNFINKFSSLFSGDTRTFFSSNNYSIDFPEQHFFSIFASSIVPRCTVIYEINSNHVRRDHKCKLVLVGMAISHGSRSPLLLALRPGLHEPWRKRDDGEKSSTEEPQYPVSLSTSTYSH